MSVRLSVAVARRVALSSDNLHLTISVKNKPYQQEHNCDDYQHWKQANEKDKYQGKCQEQDYEEKHHRKHVRQHAHALIETARFLIILSFLSSLGASVK